MSCFRGGGAAVADRLRPLSLTSCAVPCLGAQILQLLQWRDRFWDVCCSLPADRQGVAVLSLHWQWMHKPLLLRLPALLLGPSHSAVE